MSASNGSVPWWKCYTKTVWAAQPAQALASVSDELTALPYGALDRVDLRWDSEVGLWGATAYAHAEYMADAWVEA